MSVSSSNDPFDDTRRPLLLDIRRWSLLRSQPIPDNSTPLSPLSASSHRHPHLPSYLESGFYDTPPPRSSLAEKLSMRDARSEDLDPDQDTIVPNKTGGSQGGDGSGAPQPQAPAKKSPPTTTKSGNTASTNALVSAWQDRLQVLTVVTTFLASMDGTLFSMTNYRTSPALLPNEPSDQLSELIYAALVGAMILHICASLLGYIASFVLVKYTIIEADPYYSHPRDPSYHGPPLDGNGGGPPAAQLVLEPLRLRRRQRADSSLPTPVLHTPRYMPPPAVDPYDPNAIPAAAPTWEGYPGNAGGSTGGGSGGSNNPGRNSDPVSQPHASPPPEQQHHKLHKPRPENYHKPSKIPPPPIRMLTRCFYGTLVLALLGFVLALLGVVVYAWAALREPVGIVAASCVGVGVTTGIVVLIW
ncbi:hypothetical protein CONPUDRAFT_85592 [Coniophora puteana RWD-64-598 SS2]|uniref:Uncharacterized protein n=1 Tax=Coniophora puteana (strain RWD-64-598) TaxID=741705 RepID=A0A5M3M6U9_CONPW|nr:uncharacterized protein CONPUDRAFT_85592 [Coniophora puteana RWD-64-598 SS2]EIW74783.1 hypothetical protein CONPUDRAFT_85592 [Coniophora puteana RWD-64-598 SS2]